MQKVIVDPATRDRLHNLADHLEFCDESGRTLGHYLPANQYMKLVLASDGCPYTEEELARFQQEPGGRPLAEIWKSLGRT
jgi:hypothetical protein